MAKCIVCGRKLKSKSAIESGMGTKCKKVFSTYDSATQSRLLHAYQSAQTLNAYDNVEIQQLSHGRSLVHLIESDSFHDYQAKMKALSEEANEPEKSLYEQEIWDTEQGITEAYEEQKAKAKNPSALPDTWMASERVAGIMYRYYRQQQMNLSPEDADKLYPAFEHLMNEEDQKREREIEEELSNFGTEFFSDADYHIDPNEFELPQDESREYYMNVLGSILRDDDDFAYQRIHLEELNRESLSRVANIYYRLSKRYLPAFKTLPRLSTFKEFDKANQSTGMRFHAVVRDLNYDEVYEGLGGFYLHGMNETAHLPADSREKARGIGLYLNERTLNDQYQKMKDIYQKEEQRGQGGFGGTYHFVKVPDHIQYRDYIVCHEFGHSIGDQLHRNSKTQEELESYFNENREKLAKSISRYATVSVDEMIAEAFTDYTLSKSPSQASMDVMNIIEGHFHQDSRLQAVNEEKARRVVEKAKFHKPSKTMETLSTLLS